ncbi:MAG: TRAP transporter large permease subunit [Candidatus Rokubacteria bacterium]|nr:TRAP transporter large permease subunit [Candidatus Rokubacteria bacterium]
MSRKIPGGISDYLGAFRSAPPKSQRFTRHGCSKITLRAARTVEVGLITLTLQISFLTPPFGFALFFVRGSAPPGVRMADIYRGIVPFIVMQLIALGCVAAVPPLATWLPDQLLDLRGAVRGITAYD